jgi:hypothetical protein
MYFVVCIHLEGVCWMGKSIQIVTKYDNKILLPLLVVVFLFLNPTFSGMTKVTCWWWFHLWGNDFMKCNHFTQDVIKWIGLIVTTPLWRSVRMTLTLPKWGLGSPLGLSKIQRTPKNSEFNCKGQNTSPWGVFYTVGKVLKRKCQKWPHMNHLDIFSTSYVWKKGRESN